MKLPFTALLASLLLTSTTWAGVRETGADDFRITNFGPAGDLFAFAARQDMAYNSTDNEFFIIFLGRRPGPMVSMDEFEVYGQRLTTSGANIGDPILLTSVDGLGSAGGAPQNRRVVYDPGANGYILVYDAQDTSLGATSVDIYGRLIAASGQPVGPTFVVDSASTSDNRPDVAVNTVDNEFLVVWERDTGVDSQRSISARRFNGANAAALGETFRIDTVNRFKGNPTVAYNGDDNQYLVAWTNNSFAPQVQVLAADGTGQLAQEQDYATPGFFTSRSEIVYNPDLGEYLIVFAQSDPNEGMVSESYEMFGRRISAGGNPLGPGKFKVSYSDFVDRFLRAGTNLDCGPGGQCLEAGRPGLTYSSDNRSYVVVWSGSVSVGGDGDREVFVRVLPAGADPAPEADQIQISDMGSNSTQFIALLPSVVASADGVLAVWWGDDNANGGVDDEFEVWGQNLSLSLFADGFESAP